MIKRKNPFYIALTGMFILFLFLILPMDSGYELALTYIPFFFLIAGIILAIIYWMLTKLMKKESNIIFYIFLFGNILWGTLIAVDMAYKVFNF